MAIHIEHIKAEPQASKTLMGVAEYVNGVEFDQRLRHLIDMRASQINGCAFCLNMHTHEARKNGETDQRIILLSTWRETTIYTDEERAVLALTEHVTKISEGGVPEELGTELKNYFTDKQIVQLLMAIIHINAWNRLAVSTGMRPPVARH